MPIRINRGGGPSSGGLRIRRDVAPIEPAEESGSSLLPVALGAGALTVAGLAARRPGLIGSGLSKLNSLRQQLMLSGFAVPKSVLGNVGGVLTEAAERRSAAPLREFFSGKTISDYAKAYRAGSQVGPAGTIVGRPGILPSPSRLLNAGDVATRNALERAGLSVAEAERAVLQTPLSGARFGSFGSALESPTARYVFPFRRTPFNQFYEGLESFKGQHPAVLAASLAGGAAHGAATADERIPLSLPFGVAAAARYGLPYAAGALVGRTLAGGKGGGGVESSSLPVSEYGFRQAFSDPLSSFEPAALRALRRLLE